MGSGTPRPTHSYTPESKFAIFVSDLVYNTGRPGSSQYIPRPNGICSPFSMLWVFCVCFTLLDVPGIPPLRCIPLRFLKQLSQLLSMHLRNCSTGQFGHFYVLSVSVYPKLMTIGNVDRYPLYSGPLPDYL